MTGRILDHPDQDYAEEILEDLMNPADLRHARTAKRINGGGPLTNRDLCAELNNRSLQIACRLLRA
jgi:hypothetical protein